MANPTIPDAGSDPGPAAHANSAAMLEYLGTLGWSLVSYPGYANFQLEESEDILSDEDEAELQASLFGLSARLEMDSAGRVRLPEDMLKLVGLGPEVTLVGAGDRLEVRDRAAWRESRTQRMKQMPALMARISARQNGSK